MPSWLTQPILNADKTKRMGTIYTYDGRKNIHNESYEMEIEELYGFKTDWNGNELDFNTIKDDIEEEIEDGHFSCPRLYDNYEVFNAEKEKERLGHHLNKMIVNEELIYGGILEEGLKNINKRLMNETLEELKYNTDNPNTLLGKLCIRMDALELFPEWDATDFPHLNTK